MDSVSNNINDLRHNILHRSIHPSWDLAAAIYWKHMIDHYVQSYQDKKWGHEPKLCIYLEKTSRK